MLRKNMMIAAAAGLAAMATLAVSPVRAGVFVNGTFESGDLSGWTQNGGTFHGGTGADIKYPSDYIYGSGPYQTAIVSSGDVPVLASYGIHVNQVFKGSYAARVNSNDGGFYHFSELQQTATNWNAPYLYFAFNAVLQVAGHTHVEEPHFRIILDDLTTGKNLYNLFYADDTLPAGLLHTVGGYGGYKYTGWQTQQLDTGAVLGHDLKLTVLASDCSQGAHDGSVYVDDISSTAVVTANKAPVAVPVATPNSGKAGALIGLDGTKSYDAENDPIDAYEWDLNNDFVKDITGATTSFTIPSTWLPGTSHIVQLRVHETPTDALPQYSSWVPVTITVPTSGGGGGTGVPLPAGVWLGASTLAGMGFFRHFRKAR